MFFFIIATDTESVSSAGGKSRKGRNNFGPKQIEQLEVRYQQQRYLSPEERTQLARKLRLSDRQVKTWFQNRRMKEKRSVQDNDLRQMMTSPQAAMHQIAMTASVRTSPPAAMQNMPSQFVPHYGMPSVINSTMMAQQMQYSNFSSPSMTML